MKQLILIVLLLAAAYSLAFAHAPGRVSAAWDDETRLLTVTFNHKVSNISDHYVYDLIVQHNGKQVIKHTLNRQESAEGGSFVYKLIGINKGDKITVTADCNKGGKKSATITIP